MFSGVVVGPVSNLHDFLVVRSLGFWVRGGANEPYGDECRVLGGISSRISAMFRVPRILTDDVGVFSPVANLTEREPGTFTIQLASQRSCRSVRSWGWEPEGKHLLPYICDRSRGCGLAQIRQLIHLLDRAQNVVVIDGLRILARLDHRSYKQSKNVVAFRRVIFVKCEDQKTIIIARPRDVTQ